MDAIVDVVDAARGRARRARAGAWLDAVGVGAPGLVDRDGVLRFAPNLPGVVELPVQATLSERLGCPVGGRQRRQLRDVVRAPVGRGARGRPTPCWSRCGTGIGAGDRHRRRPHRGADGFAGEPGHMLVDPNGPPCPCGRRGCWERFASGSGLGRLAREAAEAGRADRVVELAGGDPEDVRGEHVTQAALEGDDAALAVMQRLRVVGRARRRQPGRTCSTPRWS